MLNTKQKKIITIIIAIVSVFILAGVVYLGYTYYQSTSEIKTETGQDSAVKYEDTATDKKEDSLKKAEPATEEKIEIETPTGNIKVGAPPAPSVP